MYNVSAHGDMIFDNARAVQYLSALRAAIRPGDVVLDLGCGIGLFALAAARAGADRVYAIDDASVTRIAKMISERNGFGHRIQFVSGNSKDVTLPERVDVIVADLRGVLP